MEAFFRESTHRHQQVCFWPDVSTFIPRSSSKDMRSDLRSDSYVLLASCSACVYECVNRCGVGSQSSEEDLGIKVETSGQKQTCWCLWVLSLKLSPRVMPFKSETFFMYNLQAESLHFSSCFLIILGRCRVFRQCPTVDHFKHLHTQCFSFRLFPIALGNTLICRCAQIKLIRLDWPDKRPAWIHNNIPAQTQMKCLGS